MFLKKEYYEGSNPMESIVITKEMLGSASHTRDITISAHFKCYSHFDPFKDPDYYNPRFKPGFDDDTAQIELIDEIDIEVKYLGECDIAIDWIRIENDKAQKVYRGEYDIQDRWSIEDFVTGIRGTTKNGVPLYKLHRIYNQDTESSNPTWWGQARYMNMVTNGMTLTRDYPDPADSYYYYTKASNIWIGVGYRSDFQMPAPYARHGNESEETMELKYGFLKTWGNIKFTDSLSSNYETRLDENLEWEDLVVDSVYNQQIGVNSEHTTYDVLQARFEWSILNTYFNPDRSNFLFRDEEWYFYSLLFSTQIIDYNVVFGNHRTKTFEEYYLQSFYALMNGSTGFIVDETFTTRLFEKNMFDVELDEPFDSTFVNMTMMKHKDYDLDSIFYIGVQNRRTDPLIYWTNPNNPSQKYLRFLSSAEFRDSCMNSPDSVLYQSYWWKRLGARKVTVPFNYTYSDNSTYNLLKISEVGSGVDSLNELWHRGEKYYDMVTDTVIGENRSLSFNLLPGQGKILKVEVLTPDTVAGFLDNYNQTKLISFKDSYDNDDIKYHLAWHKYEAVPNDTSEDYMEVQYIQSIPIKKDSRQENIFWNRGLKLPLSRNFIESLPETNYVDCNHPSIVVRDSAGVNYAYVVYTCKDSSSSNSKFARVIYAKIKTDVSDIVYNKEIFKLSSNDIETFGTPTINASAKGNYIAFTDSVRGMFVAFDDVDNENIDFIDSIPIQSFGLANPKPILFPSFNPYSNLVKDEDNASLVWLQKHDGNTGIYYTRVWKRDNLTNDTLFWTNIDKLETEPKRLVEGVGGKSLLMNVLNNTNSEPKPIIFRSLYEYDDLPPWCYYNIKENINWIDKDLSTGRNIVSSLSLFHHDVYQINQKWNESGVKNIYFSDAITSINSAQSDGISFMSNEEETQGDFNINFTLNNTTIYQEPGYYGSNAIRTDTLIGSYIDYINNSPTEAADGYLVQLAKSPQPNSNSTSDMWKNRRVFETDEEDERENPIIQASANLFYKSVFDDKLTKHSLIGFKSDSNDVYIDLPVFENELEEISSLPYNIEAEPHAVDPCQLFAFPPKRSSLTIFSLKGLVLVDDDNDGDKEMKLTMYGVKNDDIKLFLMRDSDSTKMQLTMPTSTAFPTYGTKLIYSILDSTSSEFTLIYEKQDTLAKFTEKSFIGGLATDDTVSYKSAIRKDPVKYILDFDNGANFVANNSDLLDFSVYPNPVSNTVTIQAILPETLNGNRLKNTLLELSITDITGRTILKQMVASGQVVNFDMTNYSKGVYNVKMRYTGSNEFESVRKIIKK